jgi:hypothetical protein
VAEDLDIYETIAQAVAEAREPDLSSFDPAQVSSAMQRALTFRDPRANFEHWLAGRVNVLSNGEVTLEPAEADALDQQGNGLLLRVVILGEPFGETVSITASGEKPVRYPMRSGN